jgi:hypothetical protein
MVVRFVLSLFHDPEVSKRGALLWLFFRAETPILYGSGCRRDVHQEGTEAPWVTGSEAVAVRSGSLPL